MGARKSISRMFSIFLIVIVLLTGVFPVQAAPVNASDKRGQVDYVITALDSPAIFTDVSSSHWAYSWIMSLYDAGITGGCGTSPLMYCPESTVTRAQMAIFILRGIHGNTYIPPSATGTVFSDVPADAFAADWIEQLAADGVTGGCGGGNYCPDATITRAQMAIFLLRGEHGSAYTPPVATGTVFTDVPTDAFAADWIEQLAAEGVTSGCGGGNYCPDANVTRAEMAVFLVRTFSLPITTLSPIIPPTTKALPSTTTQYLTSVSSDGSTYTFSKTTTELSTLVPGEIMAGDASPAAPYGFLRKVTSVSNSGGKVIVQTQPTTIEEAIQQGEVAVSQALSPADAASATFADGVQPMDTNPMSGSIYLQLNDVVLYDDDGNGTTTNDQITANGIVSLEPKLDFKLKVQDFQLKELYFTMTTNQTTQLKIASEVGVTAKAEKVLAVYPLGPLFLNIGIFPVTVYPVVTIVAGIDGTISANVSTGVTQTLTETAGLSYANSNWSPIQQFSNQFQYDAPTLMTGLDIKAYTGAKFQILFYGTVGPEISLNAYLKLEANPLQTPWWKLYGGLEVPVGISIDIFSHVVAGWSAVVIDYRILLAQAAIPTGRGFDSLNFIAFFYDSADLMDFLFSRPYTESIDFSRECFSDTYPYANCKFIPEMTDGVNYSIHWISDLVVMTTGTYVFYFDDVDDGARMFINDVEIMDNGWYDPSPNKLPSPRSINLTAGIHKIAVDFEQRPYYMAALQVLWSGPNFSKEIIPVVVR